MLVIKEFIISFPFLPLILFHSQQKKITKYHDSKT